MDISAVVSQVVDWGSSPVFLKLCTAAPWQKNHVLIILCK